jgi:NAD(P)-dependent dehydrogenase (short-subunit alcohol dehydrogenase family)
MDSVTSALAATGSSTITTTKASGGGSSSSNNSGGWLDTLVNHAGTTAASAPETPAARCEWAAMRRVFAANAFSVARMTALCVPLLERSAWPARPAVVNFGCIAMRWGWGRNIAHHAAAKAAVDALTRQHAAELGPRIRVNCVAPGYDDPAWIPGIPVRRLSDPAEVAHAVRYLADASFVSGQTLDVNGGCFMR